MTQERDTNDDTDPILEAHFAAARGDAAVPSDTLIARVMADAVAAQEAMQAAAEEQRVVTQNGGLSGILRAMGGWPAMAGLSCATLTGVWIGVAPPDALAVTAQNVLGAEALMAWDAGDSLFLGEEAL